MKMVFFGTPDFALPILESLTRASDFEVVAVVTQPDKPTGRKQELTAPPIKTAAEELKIPVLQFPSLKKPEVIEALAKLEADLFVVFAYGKIIPSDVLSIPRLGCVNVHPSKLPLYRGPTPVPEAIMHGDKTTAVTIMLLDEGMDTGAILAQQEVEILPTDTTPTLMNRLISEVGATLLVKTINDYASGIIKPTPQNDSEASICKLLDRDDGHVDASTPPELVDKMVRAYTPWPGVYTIIKHGDKALRVKLLTSPMSDPFMVQPEGGKSMNIVDFERGYGSLFGRIR